MSCPGVCPWRRAQRRQGLEQRKLLYRGCAMARRLSAPLKEDFARKREEPRLTERTTDPTTSPTVQLGFVGTFIQHRSANREATCQGDGTYQASVPAGPLNGLTRSLVIRPPDRSSRPPSRTGRRSPRRGIAPTP